MGASEERRKKELLKNIGSRVRRRAGKGTSGLAWAFAQTYCLNIPTRDLLEKDPSQLAGAAYSFFKLAQNRQPGETSIRAFNPDARRDGWTASSTMVQIMTDDMPFLVDSVTAELVNQPLRVRSIIHPTFMARRDGKGKLKELAPKLASGRHTRRESAIAMEISPQVSEAALGGVTKDLVQVLDQVRAAVEDWAAIRQNMRDAISELTTQTPRKGSGDLAEVAEFLQWVHDDHFTFLGYREYAFSGTGSQAKTTILAKSGLGVLRDRTALIFDDLKDGQILPAEARDFLRRDDPLVISKADLRSKVHRTAYLDAIGIKRYDGNGKVIGERLVVGLFTSVAYNSLPRDIPLLRRKLENIVASAGFPPTSHDAKALMHILETYPRDELFHAGEGELLRISLGILHVQERQQVALFSRRDGFGRFVSCLIYVPKDRYSTQLRLKMHELLASGYGGKVVAFSLEIGDTPLARLHLIVATKKGSRARRSDAQIEAALAEAARTWEDHLLNAVNRTFGEIEGERLISIYGPAFPASYSEHFEAGECVGDIIKLEEVADSGKMSLRLYHAAGSDAHQVSLKIYHPHSPLPLSDVLPVLENMGLKVNEEVPHLVQPAGGFGAPVMIHDFRMVTRDGSKVDIKSLGDNFRQAFERIWQGEMESDGLNTLVLGAGLTWREVAVLRSFAKYLRQTRVAFPLDYMSETLRKNHRLGRLIVEFFLAKFDPRQAKDRGRRTNALKHRVLTGLDQVDNADEDRIIRRFLNIADAALRTNYFQAGIGGGPKPYLAIKLDSGRIEELPRPRPLREIFVYSPRFEAIHLRGGMVARGGLRWSDRPEDFRTEILGLMKAQMVKNAVIVPVGSKGGFVVKRPPTEGGRDAMLAEGIACYKMFMSGLLDITDNLAGEKLIPPSDVVRQDGDDSYLVVAADKGTATFSDIANGIALDYGFWLGDAFASGGSVGYDHKKMGITARGTWESVKRHFREIGKDIQREEFTTIGVGDMSGDVFGNGMLLSRKTKLLAAFNHLHIFIDPDPDTEKSFAERKRLFKLPRSSWSDYDASLISKGGAIFERSAKSISLSREIRNVFGISREKVAPDELVNLLLKAEVDLLWFGGIGTYVKASVESHADADDRANNPVRVDGKDLRCKVIGEGANLGATQRGRIEFALGGGRLNTDSVDNSAGVDCSDHEVNIKILLDSVVAKGKLDMVQRNRLLGSMTAEVGKLVLRDNYLQSQAISLVQSRGNQVLDLQTRFMRMLERAGRLDRAVEFLPDEETLAERERENLGLTRPEISVILPYAKLWMYDQILASDL
ncbi:MAG: NAD-glutamate dehydrogenase, partial [Rhodospirillales bacterium]|nr:NAD-glutamate dehydrogenase [Rhodospirillales bacterium]